MNLKLSLALFTSVLVIGCASTPPPQKTTATAPGKSRRPADDLPPKATFHPGWAFTWTSNPAAVTNPAKYVAGEIANANSCVDKLSKTQDTVNGCEGNEMAAGPGLYTCDNPFSSHDYGSTVIAVPLVGKGSYVALATGRYTPPPASDGLDREIYAAKGIDAIIYDFARQVSLRAMVIRRDNLIDPSRAYAVTPLAGGKRFNEHASYVCNSATGIEDVITQWGDQIEFMSLVWEPSTDESGHNFIENQSLNKYGAAAALASDVVALAPKDIDTWVKKFPKLKASMQDFACRETDSLSPRACVARRIFDTLLNRVGTPNRPNEVLDIKTLLSVMMDVGLVAAKNAPEMKSGPVMLANLKPLYSEKSVQGKRALEAYGCVQVVRAQVERWKYNSWGDDPQ